MPSVLDQEAPSADSGSSTLAPSFRSFAVTRLRENLGDGRLEMLCGLALFFAIFQIYRGRSMNRRLAQLWLRTAHPFLSGVFRTTGTAKSALLAYVKTSFILLILATVENEI